MGRKPHLTLEIKMSVGGLPYIGTAETIEDLISLLKDQPADHKWYGWDDGCIIITDTKGEDTGFIENRL